eukprot:TRINITY_DN44530_c0_g1_i1.p1 TRINITY_DN44530_c0_g1~~TRINITY_DN44530_c0_g1_i1.p1  ORF type:complete len:908 (+),score=115.60 TRINITY_DN44530_c0_g1_i1:246-2969(+)
MNDNASLSPPTRRSHLSSRSNLTRTIYEPDYGLVRISDDYAQIDLRACAPWAGVFTCLRRRRMAGMAPVESSVLFACCQSLTDAIEFKEYQDTDEIVFASASPEKKHPSSIDDVLRACENGVEGSATQDIDLDLPTFPGGMPVLKRIVRYLEVLSAEERAAAAAAGNLGVPAGVLKVDPTVFQLDFHVDNVGIYLEAAALLRCPRLLREGVLSPASKELSSSGVLALLHRLLPFTSDPREIGAPDLLLDSGIVPCDDDAELFIARPQVVQGFCHAIQRLCGRLDAGDFKLTPRLASGSAWATVEVLRTYRSRIESMGRLKYALQSVKFTLKQTTAGFFSQEAPPAETQPEWTVHHFALHNFRKRVIESMLYSRDSRLRCIAEKAMQSTSDVHSDGASDLIDFIDPSMQAVVEGSFDNDIPEAICDSATNESLACIAALGGYCEFAQTPPILAATIVKALLLSGSEEQAQGIFEKIFVRSRKVQSMVVARQIPVSFLCAVKEHRCASIVLRNLLSRHQFHSLTDLCYLLETMLLDEFWVTDHCHELVVPHVAVRDVALYCRSRTRAVSHREQKISEQSEAGTDSTTTCLLRLREIGERLFAAIFVAHGGFLPPIKHEMAKQRCQGWTIAECPWDSGDLDLPLLEHVRDEEDTLNLARRVLLRGLWRRQRAGVESDVVTTMSLWPLGRWNTCREAGLISEAFRFLCSCWRDLFRRRAATKWLRSTSDQGGSRDVVCEDASAQSGGEVRASAVKGGLLGKSEDSRAQPVSVSEHLAASEVSSPERRMPSVGTKVDFISSKVGSIAEDRIYDQEAIFVMFSDLDIAQLHPKDLLSPWVPSQVLACRVASRCKILEEHQSLILEENRWSQREISRLKKSVRQLAEKLEIVDERSLQCETMHLEVTEASRNLL